MKDSDVQMLVLRTLAQPRIDARLGRGYFYFPEAVRANCPANDKATPQQIMAAIWSLVVRGLAYIDISQPSPDNWRLILTESGSEVLGDEEANPDDPSGYLRSLYEEIPHMSDVSRLYIEDAVNAYYHRCYLASTVMLGVAAEAVFLDLAKSFVAWKGTPTEKLEKLLSNPKASYVQKFDEFRKRLEPEKTHLPAELGDGLDLYMHAVLDLLRVSRNDAGHPTGREVGRDDCFTSLRVFARLAKRMYSLKDWLGRNGGTVGDELKHAK
jgi:hypothetical protein